MTFKQARLASDLSQTQVALLCGVSQRLVSYWDTEDAQPGAPALWSLARLLDNTLGQWAKTKLEELMPGIDVNYAGDREGQTAGGRG